MKISYNWLKQYINIQKNPEEISEILTSIGLEVEGIEKYESIKGGLKGFVTGHVLTREKHPDADKLSLTTVDIGTGTALNIVCGAPNVAAGQKVIVATEGTTVTFPDGNFIVIKKSKIRGQASEGMICAEDEIGLGTSHAGIMVLPAETAIGLPAADYFKIANDFVFEIGLTPNRSDAASHIGVARDIVAYLAARGEQISLQFPEVERFKIDNEKLNIHVSIEDSEACPRYSSLTISNVKVAESPDWLKHKLDAIGVRTINNVVDITNYVLHELGQPLHAFDANKISGNQVFVKTLADGTGFTTLEGEKRKLSSKNLMICNAKEPMCIAGVFGGIQSGVSSETQNIFLESAYFNSVSVRKTSKEHDLKTDASFRFERGTDPNITVYALKRAALLIKEVCGGEISSTITDIYPKPISDFSFNFSLENCQRLTGIEIPKTTIEAIFSGLGIQFVAQSENNYTLSVPPFKVDVQREIDVIEEVLRIYGYDNVEIPSAVKLSVVNSPKPNRDKIRNQIADFLSSNGFNETLNNSLTAASLYTEVLPICETKDLVWIKNPLSQDLNVLRPSLLVRNLESIAYNLNRKNDNLKFYEFGNVYRSTGAVSNAVDKDFEETEKFSLISTGAKFNENWSEKEVEADFFYLKSIAEALFTKLRMSGVKTEKFSSEKLYSYGIQFKLGKEIIGFVASVDKSALKKMDISQAVYYADFNFNAIFKFFNTKHQKFAEIPKFPSVRRDLALLVDKSVEFGQLKELALQAERNLLKEVNLFDVYEGKNLEANKKSYALSFILLDEKQTLTDKQIESVMAKIQKTLEEKAGAKLR